MNSSSPSEDAMNIEQENISKGSADTSTLNDVLTQSWQMRNAAIPLDSLPSAHSSSSSSTIATSGAIANAQASGLASQYHSEFPALLLSSSDPLQSISSFSQQFSSAHLYGGAAFAIIPKRFSDISKYRDVPDNQEVYADGSTDQSIIFEMNSKQESIADSDIAAFYFNDLASVNEATDAALISTGQIDEKFLAGVSLHASTSSATPSSSSSSSSSSASTSPAESVSAWYAIGIQRVSKYRDASDTAGNVVSIHLAVIRLPKIQTDIAVILNAPIAFSQSSSVTKDDDVTVGRWREHSLIFYAVLKSFTIRDWSLFK